MSSVDKTYDASGTIFRAKNDVHIGGSRRVPVVWGTKPNEEQNIIGYADLVQKEGDVLANIVLNNGHLAQLVTNLMESNDIASMEICQHDAEKISLN